ncbi:MAG TPA: hypothetical protein VGG57_01050 [Stellaceae bacterium]|jgi:hypothetical protein
MTSATRVAAHPRIVYAVTRCLRIKGMDQDTLRLFGGLLWYLESRNWAFEKIKVARHGSNSSDLRIHHSLFFINFMSAIEHVIDYLKRNKVDPKTFKDQVRNGFGKTDDYCYVRELRNSVVHRGLDPSAAGHSDQTTLRVLCPATVEDRKGKPYSCSFKYLVELAQKCREATDPAITNILEGLDLFNPQLHKPNRAETIKAVDRATEMPDWAKALAKQAFGRMDFEDATSHLAKSRVDTMRKLLDFS